MRGMIERHPTARRLAGAVAHSADWWWWLIGAGVIWLGRDGAATLGATVVVATITVTAIAVQSMKWIVRRERPSGERDFLSRHTDPHSFPSGHAARASALAVVAILMGPWWLACLACVWAAVVAGVRVATGVHYLSDALVGIGVGIGCGIIVVTRVATLLR